MIALALITCGIYVPVWYYLVNKELAEIGKAYRTDECGDSPGTSLLAMTLGFFVLVPPLVSWYRFCERLAAAARVTGASQGLEPLGLFLSYRWVVQSHLNDVLRAANAAKPQGRRRSKFGHPGWAVGLGVFAFVFFGSAGLFGQGDTDDPATSVALGVLCLILAAVSAGLWARGSAAPPEAPPISPPEDTVPTNDLPWGEPAVRPPSPPARYTLPRYTPPRPSAPRAPKAGERCPMETSASGQPKVVFADEADALRFMEKKRHLYSFDHAYECPYFNHWHVSSTARY